MRRLLAILLTCLWAGIAVAQSSNTYQNPPAGNPSLAHIGVTNPPAPVLSGTGTTGGSTTYSYAVVAYGHDASGNLLPTLMGASAMTTTGQASLSSGTPIVVTTQANPGTAQYDFLKFRNGAWQSICLAVPVFTFTSDGASCNDIGQVPLAYTLPTANNTIDLVSPFAAIGNLNVTQSGLPINQAPAQSANYNAQGFLFNNLGCPGAPGDALVEGCPIGAFAPGIVNSASGALNGSLGTLNPSTVNATGLTVSNNTTLNGATNINGNGSGGINNLPIGALTPSTIAASTIKLPGTGSVGCIQADVNGNFSITASACGTGGGGGGNPAGSANVLQTFATSTTFGAYAGSGPLASHNFGNQITNTGTLLGAQPAFTDVSGVATVAQGGTNASAAGATAANNIGAVAEASNGTDFASPSTTYTNLGGGTAGKQPLPTNGSPGNFSPLEQTIYHVLPVAASNNVSCTTSAGTYPSWDWNIGKLTTVNVSYALPGTSANCINGDSIGFSIAQSGSANRTVAFTTQDGTVQIQNAVCAAMPTGVDNIGEYYFVYNNTTVTPSWIEHCGIPSSGGSSTIEDTISASGTFGAFTSAGGSLVACHVAQANGHFLNINCTSDLNGGTCSTPPQFKVKDVTTATVGTTGVTCPTTAANFNSGTPTLTFSNGDAICIIRNANGATCSTPYYAVSAQYSLP